MTKVLAAIDGSEHAAHALVVAARLLGEPAHFVLLSVVPPWSPAVAIAANEELRAQHSATAAPGVPAVVRTHGGATGTSPYAPTADSAAEANDALYDYYRTAQRQAASTAGIAAPEHLIEEARPQKRRIGRQICECADEHGVDLIVIGSHGSSHTGELLLGSVSQYVLHHASCPVMIARGSV